MSSCRCTEVFILSTLKQRALISWDEVFDINECIRAAMSFERLESLRDEVTKIFVVLLCVVDAIADVI